MKLIIVYLFIFTGLFSCKDTGNKGGIKIESSAEAVYDDSLIVPGAYQLALYVPELRGKNVALVVNQTSMVDGKHLVDTLLALDVKIKKIFAPEHGFRGNASAGETIEDFKDKKTGLPVVSLYGKKKKPSDEDLKDIDVIIFDIQDVGVRFYTYISTMAYVMQAAAGHDIKTIILDRPNPNGHYIDGPVLEEKYKSFVGMFPVPVVYGMTIGELAQMIKGENWIAGAKDCDLKVVPCVNYKHDKPYELPVKPSPNLKNFTAVTLYPSLCFFEGSTVSVGRGTEKPFEQIGHPALKEYFDYYFVPHSMEGALHPKHEGKKCYGLDLSGIDVEGFRSKHKLELSWIMDFYKKLKDKDGFFTANNWFDKLAGTDSFRKMIIAGKSEKEIRDSWSKGLEEFKKKRKKYLLYD